MESFPCHQFIANKDFSHAFLDYDVAPELRGDRAKEYWDINKALGPRAVVEGVKIALSSLGVSSVEPEEFDWNFSIIKSDDTLFLDYVFGADWKSQPTTHASGAYEISLKSGYALKLYYTDPCGDWKAAVVHETDSALHYVDAAFYTLGLYINADTAEEYGSFSVVSAATLETLSDLTQQVAARFPQTKNITPVPQPYVYADRPE